MTVKWVRFAALFAALLIISMAGAAGAQSDSTNLPAEFYLNYFLLDETATRADPFQPQKLSLYFTVVNGVGQAVPAPDINEARIRVGGETFPAIIEIPDDIPLYVTLVLDLSGSMRPAATRLKDAVRQLIDVLPADANISIITFNARREQHPVRADFTSDRATLRAAIDGIATNEFDGGTCLYDATIQAITSLQAANNGLARRAAIVFTDGEDRLNVNEPPPCSVSTLSELINSATAVGRFTPIYTVGFIGGAGANPAALRDMASGTGGIASLAETDASRVSAAQFNELFNQIVDALNGQRRATASICIDTGRYTIEMLARVNREDIQTAFGNLSITTDCDIPTPLTLTIGTFQESDPVFFRYEIQRQGDGVISRYRVSIRDARGAEIPGSPFTLEPNPDDIVTTMDIERSAMPLGRLSFAVQALSATGAILAEAANEFTIVPTATPRPTETSTPTVTPTPTETVTLDISRFRSEGSDFVFNVVWRGGSNLTRYELQIVNSANLVVYPTGSGIEEIAVAGRDMRLSVPFAQLPCEPIRVIVNAYDDNNVFVLTSRSEDTLVPCTPTPTATQTPSSTPTASPTATATPTPTDTPSPTATSTPGIGILVEGFRIEGVEFVFDIELTSGMNVAGYQVRLTDPGGLQISGDFGAFPVEAEPDGVTTVRVPIFDLRRCDLVVVRVRPRDADGRFLLAEEIRSAEAPVVCTPTPSPLVVSVENFRYSGDNASLIFDAEVTGDGAVEQYQIVISSVGSGDGQNVRIPGDRGEFPVDPQPGGITNISIPVSQLPEGSLEFCVRAISQRRMVAQNCAQFSLAYTPTPTFTPTPTATPTDTLTPTATPTQPISVVIDPLRQVSPTDFEFGIVRAGDELPVQYRITILQNGQQIPGQFGRFTVPVDPINRRTSVRFSADGLTSPEVEVQVVALDENDDPLIGVPQPLSGAAFSLNLPTSTPVPTPTFTPTVALIVPSQGGVSYADGVITVDTDLSTDERVTAYTVIVLRTAQNNQPAQEIARVRKTGAPSEPLTINESELSAPLPGSGVYALRLVLELNDGARLELDGETREFSVSKPTAVTGGVEQIIRDAITWIQENRIAAALIILIVIVLLLLLILILRRATRREELPYSVEEAPPPQAVDPMDVTNPGLLRPLAIDEVKARLVLQEPYIPNWEREITSGMSQIVLGRGDPKPDTYKVILPDPRQESQISREHAILRFEDGRFVLIANQVDNPTFLDDVMLTAGVPAILERGEAGRLYKIELGNSCQVRLSFQYAAEVTLTAPAVRPNTQDAPPAAPPPAPAPQPDAQPGRTLPSYVDARVSITLPADHDPAEVEITRNVFVMGRGRDADLRFDVNVVTQEVARKQAQLEWVEDSHFILTNLSQSNPTLLNGEELPPEGSAPLVSGNTYTIQFASNPVRAEVTFRYVDLRYASVLDDEKTGIQQRFDDDKTGIQQLSAPPPPTAPIPEPPTEIPAADTTPAPRTVPTPFLPGETQGSTVTPLPESSDLAPEESAPAAAFIPPPPEAHTALPAGVTAELRVISMPGGSDDGKVIPFVRTEVKIGRDPANDYVVPEAAKFISRNHCMVYWKHDRFAFKDVKSQIGTDVIALRAGKEEIMRIADGREVILEPRIQYTFYLSPGIEKERAVPAAKFSFYYNIDQIR